MLLCILILHSLKANNWLVIFFIKKKWLVYLIIFIFIFLFTQFFSLNYVLTISWEPFIFSFYTIRSNEFILIQNIFYINLIFFLYIFGKDKLLLNIKKNQQHKYHSILWKTLKIKKEKHNITITDQKFNKKKITSKTNFTINSTNLLDTGIPRHIPKKRDLTLSYYILFKLCWVRFIIIIIIDVSILFYFHFE